VSQPRNGRIRTPSIAEVIADRLRERIIANDLADGDLLPKQEDLLSELGVSKPSMQGALRILEAEGLISVRRGKQGGAVVHRPRVDSAANAIEMILRSRAVSVDDLLGALRNLEPVCAKLCASRSDRAEEVLPRLRQAHAVAQGSIDDIVLFTEHSRRFHQEMVACCGNETIILVIGALEAVWSAHAKNWAQEHFTTEGYPPGDRAYREQGLADHELLLRLIERGDGEGAMREAQHHLEWSAPTYRVHHEDQMMPTVLGPGRAGS
jgi:GntR family transcriptional repressor for pyruvate dehydrogenase complex